MQEQPNGSRPQKLPGLVYRPTSTKWITQRGNRFIARWVEDGKRQTRSFGSYEAACAYVRDYIMPYMAQEGGLPPSAVAPGKGKGWVYVFRSSGDGEPVKVGWSTDPAKRLNTLRTGHPYKIDLVLLLPAGRGLERAIHARLAEYRLQGEWFSREAESLLSRLIAESIQRDAGSTHLPHHLASPHEIPANQHNEAA